MTAVATARRSPRPPNRAAYDVAHRPCPTPVAARRTADLWCRAKAPAAAREPTTFDALVELAGRRRLTPRLALAAAGLVRDRDACLGEMRCRARDPLSGGVAAHRHTQAEITEAFAGVIARGGVNEKLLRRLHGNAGVEYRSLVLPLTSYGDLTSFGQANDLFLEHAVELGAQALADALKAADLTPTDIDQLVCATVTGLAIPSLDARIAAVLGLRPDVRRVPMVGLGCVAGAAGIARLHDYLTGHPGCVAALVTVELCSLTVQRDDTTTPNLVASSLFGDGAAAVVARGDPRSRPVEADSERLYPEHRRAWLHVSHLGLRSCRRPLRPCRRYIARTSTFPGRPRLTGPTTAVVCHPGGPKVIDALRDTLGLTDHDLALTRVSLPGRQPLSASGLHVLADTLSDRPPAPGVTGADGVGPGFCPSSCSCGPPSSKAHSDWAASLRRRGRADRPRRLATVVSNATPPGASRGGRRDRARPLPGMVALTRFPGRDSRGGLRTPPRGRPFGVLLGLVLASQSLRWWCSYLDRSGTPGDHRP